MRVARVVLVAALLLGACNGGNGERGDDTLPPRPSSTTVPDYAVPEVIDVAYVEKVMAALDRVYGDAIRIVARERSITPEFLERLVAIYSESQFERTQEIWVKDVAGGLTGLSSSPGDPSTKIRELLRADRSCVIVKADRDFSATSVAPDSPTPQEFVALIPAEDSRDPRDLNPTPWMLSFDGYVVSPAGAPPEGPCDAS